MFSCSALQCRVNEYFIATLLCGSQWLCLISPSGTSRGVSQSFGAACFAFPFCEKTNRPGLRDELRLQRETWAEGRGEERRAELRLGFHSCSSLQALNESKVLPAGYSADQMSPTPLVRSRLPSFDMFMFSPYGLEIKRQRSTKTAKALCCRWRFKKNVLKEKLQLLDADFFFLDLSSTGVQSGNHPCKHRSRGYVSASATA